MRLSKEQELEIQLLRGEKNQTLRPISNSLEEWLFHPLPVLDHGFVRVVDYMGDDSAIVQAARVSYGRGTKKVSEDRGLINYLIRHRHSTPFEMCEIKFHVKLPIFVARQWIRHRTANVNEYSARYSILDREFYVPDSVFQNENKLEERAEKKSGQKSLLLVAPTHTAGQSTTNKQGREAQSLSAEDARELLDIIKSESSRAYTNYMKLLNEDATGAAIDPSRKGIARELARMVLPTNIYTQWYWKIDLHNLMHFISLRADTHAQFEIREYANVLLQALERWVPLTAAAFREHVLGAAHVSATGLKVIRRLVKGEKVDQPNSGMSAREWRELMELLEPSSRAAES